MAKKVGFFGGAFDPPHMGHVNAAKEASGMLLKESPDLSAYPAVKQRTAKMFENITL